MAVKKTKYDILVELLTDWEDGGRLDLLLDAIKAVTDVLPDGGALTTIQTDLDNPDQYKADVAALALEATLTAIKGAGWSDENLTTIDALIDAIKAVTDALPVFPADPADESDLEAAITAAHAITDALVDSKVMGRTQIVVEPIDLDNTAIGTYNTLIGTTQNVIIESLIFRCTRDLSGDAGFTGISLQTDDTTNQVFVSQAEGVKANLTADSQLAWTGAILLKVGQYIDFSVYGGAVANLESLCDIVVTYRAVVSGGYLA